MIGADADGNAYASDEEIIGAIESYLGSGE
jgi:hypothetical protein